MCAVQLVRTFGHVIAAIFLLIAAAAADDDDDDTCGGDYDVAEVSAWPTSSLDTSPAAFEVWFLAEK